MKNTQPVQKTRAHNVLFFRDTPFKPKRVELKTRYKRQPKHRLQNGWPEMPDLLYYYYSE